MGNYRTQLTMKLLPALVMTILTTSAFSQASQNLSDFLPKGFVVFEKVFGDLNKDGVDDCVLIIKGTDKSQIIIDEFRGQLDRNRRGLIVLFNKNGHYELAVKNYNCFSSENEEGGVYFAPELSVEVNNGNLIAHYGHGRYGYWKYTFRFRNSDFDLIGYDQAERSSLVSDWVNFDEISINLLTRRKLIKKVIYVTTDGEEKCQEIWKNLSITNPVRLSVIKDIDEFDINKIIKEK
jgi:hypothetical protein